MTTAKLLGASGLIAGMMLIGGIDQAQAQTKDITVILPNPSAINVFSLHSAIGYRCCASFMAAATGHQRPDRLIRIADAACPLDACTYA